ncbi:MAG: PQQ-like beta-propeller repeat protein [Deltaproteobacteria bacterium]|nr:PQQ-like beta-propeller repeat protein [Deltaproteobacteria bacterium]
MHTDGAQDHLTALDVATGATLWTLPIGEAYPALNGAEGGPASTPAIEDDAVYALSPRGVLVAARLADGRELWRLPLVERLAVAAPLHGFATSPLVVGERVIVVAGGSGGKSVVAVDKATGTIAWAAGDDTAEFASPIPAELGDVAQVVGITDHTVTGFDPATGTRLWSAPGNEGRNISPTPVLIGADRVLAPGWWRSTALRIERAEGGLAAREEWQTTDLKGTFAAPVLHEGNLYGFSGAFLTCLSATDGARRWKSRAPGGDGLILVDGHLVILGAGGTVVIAEASPVGYRETARLEVFDRGSRTYPTFADGRIFVRTTHDIAAVRVVGANEPHGLLTRLRELARTGWVRVMRGVRATGRSIVNRVLPLISEEARHRDGPGEEPGGGASDPQRSPFE